MSQFSIYKTYWACHLRLRIRAGKRCGSSSRLLAVSPHGTSPADLKIKIGNCDTWILKGFTRETKKSPKVPDWQYVAVLTKSNKDFYTAWNVVSYHLCCQKNQCSHRSVCIQYMQEGKKLHQTHCFLEFLTKYKGTLSKEAPRPVAALH